MYIHGTIAPCQRLGYCPHMPLEHDKQFQMRASEAFLKALDDWRRKQSDLPSRAEAIRRLVEIGIKADAKPKKRVI